VSWTAVDRFPRANFLLASTSRTHQGTDRITKQYDNGFIPVEVDCSPQDSSKAPGTLSAFFLTYLYVQLHVVVCWDVTLYRGVLGCDTVVWCAGMWHCTSRPRVQSVCGNLLPPSFFCFEDGGGMVLWNVGTCLPGITPPLGKYLCRILITASNTKVVLCVVKYVVWTQSSICNQAILPPPPSPHLPEIVLGQNGRTLVFSSSAYPYLLTYIM
jgi:hypothetical protein